jgi:hypothetical protein
LTSCFPCTLLRYFVSDFEMVPVVPVVTGITSVFTFHVRYISIVRSLYFRIVIIIIISSGGGGGSSSSSMPKIAAVTTDLCTACRAVCVSHAFLRSSLLLLPVFVRCSAKKQFHSQMVLFCSALTRSNATITCGVLLLGK